MNELFIIKHARKSDIYYLFSILLVPVVSSETGSFSSMDFLKPFRALPIELPNSGSLPGPKIIRTIPSIIKRCIGWRRPLIFFHLLLFILIFAYSLLRNRARNFSLGKLWSLLVIVISFINILSERSKVPLQNKLSKKGHS